MKKWHNLVMGCIERCIFFYIFKYNILFMNSNSLIKMPSDIDATVHYFCVNIFSKESRMGS